MNTCTWKQNEYHDFFKTECDNGFQVNEDCLDNSNWIKFCIFCGAPVEIETTEDEQCQDTA